MLRSVHTRSVGRLLALASAAASAFALAASAVAEQSAPARPVGVFRPLGTFDVMAGNGSAVAEIIDFSLDERQIVYTDAPSGQIGFVDLSDPRHPVGRGTVDVGGEPTSLVVREPWVLVAVDTSPSFTEPSGELVVVHRLERGIVARLPLGGQPDSIALSPDRKRAVIVIENERDEDVADGLLPQPPSGRLLVVEMRGGPASWQMREVDLSSVAASASDGSDLEPEFVDVNSRNLAVVTFQENNHIGVVDLVRASVVHHFSAGSAALSNVDTVRNDLIELTGSLERRREPDGVTWIDRDSFATANEGDYEDASGAQGGSRGFTIFNVDGTIEFESGGSFESWLVRAGHHNESRAAGKGNEPESVDAGTFGGRRLLFVGSERANVVGVYDVGTGQPVPLQILPTGIRPEGLKASARRGLFAASTEAAAAAVGIPTMITIYGLVPESIPPYPMIEGTDEAGAPGLPVPWLALSGLVGDPFDANTLYGVSDSALARGYIYTIDVSSRPARIVRRLEVSGATGIDLEGIAVGPDGHFWVASEGNATTTRLTIASSRSTARRVRCSRPSRSRTLSRRGGGATGTRGSR
jgi:Esterase-like activity of phytase